MILTENVETFETPEMAELVSVITLAIQKENTSRSKIELLENQRDKDHQEMITQSLPLFNKILSGWCPRIGESIVAISFESQVCYELIVTEVNGRIVRAREGDKSCMHTVELGLGREDYAVPSFVVPVSLYLKLKPFLRFRFIETYINKGDGFTNRLPDWA